MDNLGDILIVSIQLLLDDAAAVQLKDHLPQRIYETKARGLIVDLTGVDVVDSFIGQLIIDIVLMAGLMGVRVVIIGMQPTVATKLMELGMELRRVLTALNLEKGLAALRRQIEENGNGAG